MPNRSAITLTVASGQAIAAIPISIVTTPNTASAAQWVNSSRPMNATTVCAAPTRMSTIPMNTANAVRPTPGWISTTIAAMIDSAPST